MRRRILLCAIALSWLTPSSWADWPQFRHDAAHTGYTDESVRPPLELRWKWVDDPEPNAAGLYPSELENYLYRGPSASVGIGRSYWRFPEMVASRDSLFLNRYASGATRLDRLTGRVLWQQSAPSRLVALDGDSLVYAYGTLRRHRGLADTWGEVSVADAATGELRWRLTSDDALPQFWPGTLGVYREYCAVNDGAIAVTVGVPDPAALGGPGWDPCLRLLSVRDGAVIGETRCLPGYNAVGAGGAPMEHYLIHEAFPVRAWGRTLMVLAYSDPRPRGRVPGPWALSSDGGVLRLTPPDAVHREWHAPVVLAGDQGLVFACEGRKPPARRLTCRDAFTGELIWARPLISSPNAQHGCAVDGSAVYIGLTQGAVYALDMETGEVKWRTVVGKPLPPELSGPSSGFQPICSVSSKTVWVVYREKLLALDKDTGEIEWETDETECTWYEPVIHGGWVYLLTVHGVEAWAPVREDDKEDQMDDEDASGAGSGTLSTRSAPGPLSDAASGKRGP